MTQPGPTPLRIVESSAVPPNTFIVGDFSEFERARHEDRPINPRAFAVLNMTAEHDPNCHADARAHWTDCECWCHTDQEKP